MKLFKSKKACFWFVILLFLSSACSQKAQYEVVQDYLINDLKVDFGIQGKTYIVISAEQCMPCVKAGIEAINNALQSGKEVKFIIASTTKKKARFLLPLEITQKADVIVDIDLAMENIPLFADNLYVKFDIEDQEIANLDKISMKDLLK